MWSTVAGGLMLQSVLVATVLAAAGTKSTTGTQVAPSVFTAPGKFPTSMFTKYYNNPTQTASQVQPIIKDPVETGVVYPLSLTSPDTIPTNDTTDPHPLPPTASSSQLIKAAFDQIVAISTNPIFGTNNCVRCQAGLEVAKFLAMASPASGPELAVQLCFHFNFNSACGTQFSKLGLGAVITQVIANANVGGYDGQMLCQNFLGLCPLPPASPAQPHLLPAPRFGAYTCDTPMALAMAAVQAIPPLTGTEDTGFSFSIYTGDLVSHDPDNQLSRAYVEYTESLLYDLFRKMLGSGPVYAVLGNHDSYNQAQDAPHMLGGALASQFSWNYDHLAALWQHEDWLPESAVELAKAHYSAFMVKRVDGLRIISLNTDMWYKANYFNYINLDLPDNSGMLRFLTDELQAAEDAGDRVWIIGHVLSGWDGSNPLVNPTDLFYQIVDRYSPHVIANIFFGHTHEDQASIFYANNATDISAQNALVTSWMGPSITPPHALELGLPDVRGRLVGAFSLPPACPSLLEPAQTFDVLDAYTWRSDVNAYHSLDPQLEFGPTFAFEYSTRDTYAPGVPGWGPNDPLNATFWHLVTEAMETNSSLVTTFNTLQGKTSVLTAPCTGDCITAKICYIRSGSAAIAKQNCIQGFGSVQS
ncbi:SER THR protein phosphatase family protein [Mycena venus]|uniref:SER THR protein phosphatase family protein n=1 Tax=Mycena venus TaxID=2733690 RepID=A0A8H6XV93_9AGAR|nr:SER THR protein phosphatase family protein [Mycena venus]